MSAVGTDGLALDGGTGDGHEWPETVEQAPGAYAELPLRCVASDMHDDGCCQSRIPRAVVERAWRRELETSGDHEGRFFHLIHDDGVWQAYGLGDGQVRGVYCPAHNSQRAARTRAAVCEAGDVVYELPLAA